MKKEIGFLVLLLALAVLTGCTQPAETSAPTTATPAMTTEATPVPTTVTTTVATPISAANVSLTTVPTAKPTTGNTTEPVNVTMTATIAPSETKEVTVNIFHIRNGSFEPSATTVLPGTGITWINDDVKVHTVKSTGARPGMFTSGEILPTGQFSYTFGDAEGIFTFTDPKYPGMNGTIIVKKVASIVGVAPLQATIATK